MDPYGRDLVTLSLAPEGRYARVARTVVASCASLEGFPVDDLGDVRLLVDTAFHALTDLGRGPVEIRIEASPRSMSIEMSSTRVHDGGWSEPDVRLLETVASVVGFERDFSVRGERLVMRVAIRPKNDGGSDVT